MTRNTSSIRYGVFLRPDPLTCWAQTQINLALREQFGIVSAAAFPPHATLVGNLHTDATAVELVDLLTPVFANRVKFDVYNAGIQQVGDSLLYNVHEDGKGAPNAPLVDLAAAVKSALLPVALDHDDYLVPQVGETEFWAHLSLASHDMRGARDRLEEIGEFLAGLPISAPPSFTAKWFTLFAFETDDWTGEWWRSLRWTHQRSWSLQPGADRD